MNGWTLATVLKVHRFIINIRIYQDTPSPINMKAWDISSITQDDLPLSPKTVTCFSELSAYEYARE